MAGTKKLEYLATNVWMHDASFNAVDLKVWFDIFFISANFLFLFDLVTNCTSSLGGIHSLSVCLSVSLRGHTFFLFFSHSIIISFSFSERQARKRERERDRQTGVVTELSASIGARTREGVLRSSRSSVWLLGYISPSLFTANKTKACSFRRSSTFPR